MMGKISYSKSWRAVIQGLVLAVGAACVLATVALAQGIEGVEESEPPDLTGYWEIAPELSDDASEKLREALRAQRELERSRGRGGLRAGRPGGPGGSGVADERRARLEALAESVRILSIEHRDPVLELESGLADSDWALTAYTDGREFERPSPSGENVTATAGWERGGRLVVRYEPDERLQAKETWELVAEGSRILVTTEITGKSIEPVRYQRVYDRVEIIPWDVPE